MESVTTWTRLELGCRRDDWSESLRARLHDPAWMLARQWQTGEFRGEDAGAPVAAEIAYRTRLIDRLRRGEQPVEDISLPLGGDRVVTKPLEVEVEREGLPVTKRDAAYLGLAFERALGNRDAVRKSFRRSLPLGWSADDQQKASDRAAGFMAAVAKRVVDGAALLTAIRQGQAASAVYAATAYGQAHPLAGDDAAAADAAGVALRDIGDRIIPPGATPAAWNDRRQEYCFRVSAPDAGAEVVLEAEEYYEGRLDWYAFTVDRSANATLAPVTPARAQPAAERRAFIPSPVKFLGRPNERWWRFEDGRVNLAALDVQRTELAHVVVSEFALVFGNDWFELPLELPAGSLTWVEQLRVRDSFGYVTDVPAGNDAGWAMFALSGRASRSEPYSVRERFLFLPPSLSHALQGTPLEEVRLIRDEMANMAWAVEAVVQDEVGLPVSGHDLAAAGERRVRERARRFAQEAVREWLPFVRAVEDARKALVEARGTAGEPAAKTALANAEQAEVAPRDARDRAADAYERSGGDRRDLAGVPREETDARIVPTYRLFTEVPRNWIPLVPRAIGGGQTMLRRGAMPDLRNVAAGAALQRVQARGVLLRPDVRPFHLFEEEIPRTGAHVTRAAQHARWIDGSSRAWIGRRKEPGRGEGWSGLRFDRVDDAVKRE